MTMPTAHLFRREAGDKSSVRIEEVLAVATCVTELRRSPLPGREGEAALAAADVMNYCDRPAKLVDVAVADRIATHDDASHENADA
jgi:hypothetical protein